MSKKIYSSVPTEAAFAAIPFAAWASRCWRAAGHTSSAVWCSHPSAMSERNGVPKETVNLATNMLYHINADTKSTQHSTSCPSPVVQSPQPFPFIG